MSGADAKRPLNGFGGWTVQRADDGWRWMEDRGSTTANHYDHVHVTVYGNAGG